MKKCYLKIYLNHNLGDDLFAKIISERYPNTKFIATSYNKQKSDFKNIKVIKSYAFRAVNKFLKIATKKKVTIEKCLAKKYQIALVIGGSLFIEGKSDDYDELEKSKQYYIIGTNFGPYRTEEYIDYCNKLFKKANFVCFRDKKSYNLFKDSGENIRQAPDIVFGLDTSKVKNKDSKRVIFSIIDCTRKIGQEYQKKYEETIIELTKYFDSKGYKITYMSFCKKENDEEAIERIEEKIKKEKLNGIIEKYYYDGNLEEAINVLADSQIIIGSRFHANILGLVLNKTIIPVIYSEKTRNVLDDMNFKGKIIDIKNLDEFNINELTADDLHYKLDVSKEKENSKMHFSMLDNVLM